MSSVSDRLLGLQLGEGRKADAILEAILAVETFASMSVEEIEVLADAIAVCVEQGALGDKTDEAYWRSQAMPAHRVDVILDCLRAIPSAPSDLQSVKLENAGDQTGAEGVGGKAMASQSEAAAVGTDAALPLMEVEQVVELLDAVSANVLVVNEQLEVVGSNVRARDAWDELPETLQSAAGLAMEEEGLTGNASGLLRDAAGTRKRMRRLGDRGLESTCTIEDMVINAHLAAYEVGGNR